MADSKLTAGEKALFDLILAVFPDDTEDVEAYRDEYPAVFPDASVGYMWTAYFMGGGLPDETTQAPSRSCGIRGMFMFDGVFTSKEKAQTYACTLKTVLPPTTSTNLNFMLWTKDPEIVRSVVKREADQPTSGEVRVWRLTAEFDVSIDYK